MPKSVKGKIWSSVLSKILLMVLIFGFFYIIGDSLGWIPQSVKDLVSFMADNFNTFAFCFCFVIGSYVFVKVLQTRNKSGDIRRD
jgi:putative Mn2+ efflux pump MntP